MSVSGAQAAITSAVSAWTGITVQPHRFGGVEYVIGKREIGHIHGDHLVDIPFPKKVRDALVQAGKAQSHHVLPESGWVSLYLRQPEDVEQAIALLEESYQIARQQACAREHARARQQARARQRPQSSASNND